MVIAKAAEVFWDAGKKAWIVRIQVGEEAVRRAPKGARRDMGDDALRSLAVDTARDEGYELAPGVVTIRR
jgi:hypothetical protein